MKAIGFNQGQYGDLCINLIACKSFKQVYPDSTLIFGVNHRYRDLAPIFLKHPHIDGIHVWEGYDNWPTERDLDYMASQEFDHIFHPMPRLSWDWQTKHHQTEEVCFVNGLPSPGDLQIYLNPSATLVNNNYKGFIVVCGVGATDGAKKNLDEQKLDYVCGLIVKLGYQPLFLASSYKEHASVHTPFVEAVGIMLGCKALVTIDSALCWIASGYQFPTLGLYNQFYYADKGAQTSKNWQPINPNAVYLEAAGVNEIPNEAIETALKSIL